MSRWFLHWAVATVFFGNFLFGLFFLDLRVAEPIAALLLLFALMASALLVISKFLPLRGDSPDGEIKYNQMSPRQKLFEWTDVNRGLYLCHVHGGFGGEGDDFSVECPFCSNLIGPAAERSSNSIARLISMLNNHQSRADFFTKGIAAASAAAVPVIIASGEEKIGLALVWAGLGASLTLLGLAYTFLLSARNFATSVEVHDKFPKNLDQFKEWVFGRDIPSCQTYMEWLDRTRRAVAHHERQRIVGDLMSFSGVCIVVVSMLVWFVFK